MEATAIRPQSFFLPSSPPRTTNNTSFVWCKRWCAMGTLFSLVMAMIMNQLIHSTQDFVSDVTDNLFYMGTSYFSAKDDERKIEIESLKDLNPIVHLDLDLDLEPKDSHSYPYPHPYHPHQHHHYHHFGLISSPYPGIVYLTYPEWNFWQQPIYVRAGDTVFIQNQDLEPHWLQVEEDKQLTLFPGEILSFLIPSSSSSTRGSTSHYRIYDIHQPTLYTLDLEEVEEEE
jgi:hypothetical protein